MLPPVDTAFGRPGGQSGAAQHRYLPRGQLEQGLDLRLVYFVGARQVDQLRRNPVRLDHSKLDGRLRTGRRLNRARGGKAKTGFCPPRERACEYPTL